MLKISRGVGAACIAGLIAMPAAHAADLPSMKSAPAAPVVVDNSWTGFYLGLEGGANFQNTDWNTTALATGFLVDPSSNLAKLNSTYGRVGGLIGYNWQFNQFVVGLEGDIAGDFGNGKSSIGLPGTVGPIGGVNAPSADSIKAQSDFDASIRGRLGFLATPSTLLYATGGVAFLDLKYSANCPGVGNSWCNAPDNASSSNVRVGWTIGAGIEQRLGGNWSIRGEYRYSDFGTRSYSLLQNTNAAPDINFFNSRVTTNFATAALVYKFGVAEAPAVVAKY
jgi:outer membrane immunogenic protein